MNYYIFVRPVIGAGIGYITNWIAVKMLFRPLNPIKIGKIKMPFTPGIIPKNKERIALAIGDSISSNLLTKDALYSALLSNEKKEEIRNNLTISLKSFIQNNPEKTSIQLINSYISNEKTEQIEKNILTVLTCSIFNTIKESNISEIISEQIQIAASEKLKKSIIGVFGGNAIISSLGPEITLKIDEYIDNNGQALIHNMVSTEIKKLENMSIAEIVENTNTDFVEIIMEIYEKIILEKLPSILDLINISKIVSDKIIAMPTLELEKIILEIMKKELNALVNLGALIGFILGLLNLLF